jgi:hypothetical protein
VRHAIQLVLGLGAMAGVALCWSQVKSLVDVAPVTEGQPATVSVVYDPPMMVATLALATAAGVLGVLGVAGVRRAALKTPLDPYTP